MTARALIRKLREHGCHSVRQRGIPPDLAVRQLPDSDPGTCRRPDARHTQVDRTRPRTMPRPQMANQMRKDTTTNMKEATVKTYTARLEQENDGRWSVELEEEPRAHTWGKTIDQALTRMREAAALWFQTDEASIELVPRPVLPKATGRTVEQARKARDQARNADRLAIDQTRKAAVALTSRGISMRDAAAILGISHQRVHQLLTPETPPRRKAG